MRNTNVSDVLFFILTLLLFLLLPNLLFADPLKPFTSGTMTIVNLSKIDFDECTVELNGKNPVSRVLSDGDFMVVEVPNENFSMFQLDCTATSGIKYHVNLNDDHFFGLQGGTYPQYKNIAFIILAGSSNSANVDHIRMLYSSTSSKNISSFVASTDSKTLDQVS